MNSVELNNSFIGMQQIPEGQKVIGQHICSKMETLVASAMALQKIAEVATGHGSRIVTSGVTLATGLGYLASGDLMTGGITTLVGLKEAINIWRSVNPKSDIACLLNDANAGVDMIKTLEEANAESFKTVDTNLDIIRRKIQRMNDQMQKIKSISVEGQKELETIKQEASELYDEAQEEFKTAKQSFTLSQKQFKKANGIFVKALKQFDALFELAQTTDISDTKKLEIFVEIAKKIQQDCAKAQELIKQGNQLINSGLESLDSAREKEMSAKEKAVVAMERAKLKMKIIEAQAKVKREYEQKVTETQEEVDHIQARNQNIRALLNELSDDLKEAKKLSDNKFGPTSIIFGVIPAAVMGFSAGGVTGALIGGMGGGTVVHNRGAIINKVDDLVNGPVTFLDTNPNKEECVKVRFSSRSSGWFNRFVRKKAQSYTVGIVDVKVGKQLVSLPFNLNKDYKISKPDLYELQQNLGKKVISGEITAQECLNVIAELENKDIDRGQSKKPQRGLVASNCSYFADLKLVCVNIVKQENKSEQEIVAEVVY